jgi:hypothetical protein
VVLSCMLVDTYIYLGMLVLISLSLDYHRILQKSRITCVVLIDLCLGKLDWIQHDCRLHIFVYTRYLSKISNR